MPRIDTIYTITLSVICVSTCVPVCVRSRVCSACLPFLRQFLCYWVNPVIKQWQLKQLAHGESLIWTKPLTKIWTSAVTCPNSLHYQLSQEFSWGHWLSSWRFWERFSFQTAITWQLLKSCLNSTCCRWYCWWAMKPVLNSDVWWAIATVSLYL